MRKLYYLAVYLTKLAGLFSLLDDITLTCLKVGLEVGGCDQVEVGIIDAAWGCTVDVSNES